MEQIGQVVTYMNYTLVEIFAICSNSSFFLLRTSLQYMTGLVYWRIFYSKLKIIVVTVGFTGELSGVPLLAYRCCRLLLPTAFAARCCRPLLPPALATCYLYLAPVKVSAPVEKNKLDLDAVKLTFHFDHLTYAWKKNSGNLI